jgi:hypothetical protein
MASTRLDGATNCHEHKVCSAFFRSSKQQKFARVKEKLEKISSTMLSGDFGAG